MNIYNTIRNSNYVLWNMCNSKRGTDIHRDTLFTAHVNTVHNYDGVPFILYLRRTMTDNTLRPYIDLDIFVSARLSWQTVMFLKQYSRAFINVANTYSYQPILTESERCLMS